MLPWRLKFESMWAAGLAKKRDAHPVPDAGLTPTNHPRDSPPELRGIAFVKYLVDTGRLRG